MTQGGFGVVLKIDISSTLTVVAKVLDSDFPEQVKTLWRYVPHDSTSGYAEYVATGVKDLGEITVTLLWDVSETTHAQMLTTFGTDLPVDMSIQDPDGDETIAFSAHIRSIGRISKSEQGYQAKVGIQPTGAPTIT